MRRMSHSMHPVTCARCGSQSKVYMSRSFDTHLYRRRRCTQCGHEWATREVHGDEWDVTTGRARAHDRAMDERDRLRGELERTRRDLARRVEQVARLRDRVRALERLCRRRPLLEVLGGE